MSHIYKTRYQYQKQREINSSHFEYKEPHDPAGRTHGQKQDEDNLIVNIFKYKERLRNTPVRIDKVHIANAVN